MIRVEAGLDQSTYWNQDYLNLINVWSKLILNSNGEIDGDLSSYGLESKATIPDYKGARIELEIVKKLTNVSNDVIPMNAAYHEVFYLKGERANPDIVSSLKIKTSSILNSLFSLTRKKELAKGHLIICNDSKLRAKLKAHPILDFPKISSIEINKKGFEFKSYKIPNRLKEAHFLMDCLINASNT